MTDEEKKAIESVKEEYKKGIEQANVLFPIFLNQANIILNLIEKQQKEIEELRNEVMEKELIIDGMKEDRRIAVEEIQEQYYVSKDKIKSIIEEIYNEPMNYNPDEYWIENECKGYAIDRLQSLLEKE